MTWRKFHVDQGWRHFIRNLACIWFCGIFFLKCAMTRLFKAHAQTIHDRILKTRACYIITRSISSLLSRPHYQACQKHIGKSGPSSFGIRRMVLTKARTESGNLPNGTQAPSFEVSLSRCDREVLHPYYLNGFVYLGSSLLFSSYCVTCVYMISAVDLKFCTSHWPDCIQKHQHHTAQDSRDSWAVRAKWKLCSHFSMVISELCMQLLEPLTGKTYSSTELENAPASVIIFMWVHWYHYSNYRLVSIGHANNSYSCEIQFQRWEGWM